MTPAACSSGSARAHYPRMRWSLGMLLALLLTLTGCSGESPPSPRIEVDPSAAAATAGAAEPSTPQGTGWSRQKTLDFAADKLGIDITVRDVAAIESQPDWSRVITTSEAVQSAREITGSDGEVLSVEPVVVTRKSLKRPIEAGQSAETLIWFVVLRTEQRKFSDVQVYARHQAGERVRNPMVSAKAVAPVDALSGKPYYSAIM